jgi:hypothetical protein
MEVTIIAKRTDTHLAIRSWIFLEKEKREACQRILRRKKGGPGQ